MGRKGPGACGVGKEGRGRILGVCGVRSAAIHSIFTGETRSTVGVRDKCVLELLGST